MLLEGILAIASQQGLFKLISRGTTSIVVESLLTGKRMPAFSTSRISSLEDVTVYTYEEDVPLKKVFINIYNECKGNTPINAKADNKQLLEFFGKVLPEFDKEKVYVSDIKKIVTWYNLLFDKGYINDETIKADAEEQAKLEAEIKAAEGKE